MYQTRKLKLHPTILNSNRWSNRKVNVCSIGEYMKVGCNCAQIWLPGVEESNLNPGPPWKIVVSSTAIADIKKTSDSRTESVLLWSLKEFLKGRRSKTRAAAVSRCALVGDKIGALMGRTQTNERARGLLNNLMWEHLDVIQFHYGFSTFITHSSRTHHV